jgi:hypothetical protein
LSVFNASIDGLIGVECGFFGTNFTDWIADKFNLRGKNAEAQFALVSKMLDYSRMDFTCEVSTNRKAVYLNFLFWAQHIFVNHGFSLEQKQTLMIAFCQALEFNHIEIPLPV